METGFSAIAEYPTAGGLFSNLEGFMALQYIDRSRSTISTDSGYDEDIASRNSLRKIKRRRAVTFFSITYCAVTTEQRDSLISYLNSTRADTEIPFMFDGLLVLGQIAGSPAITRVANGQYEVLVEVRAKSVQAVLT